MSENLDNKAQRGSISPIIITALSSGDKYGYEICKEIEHLSNGKLILKQPSLYSSLRRMEEQNLVHSYWKDSELGGNRHYYVLTDEGKKIFETNKDKWLMSDLISALPANEFDIAKEDIKEDKVAPVSEMSVGSQETLFSMANSRPEVKKFDEAEEVGNNQAFYQFDLFGQDVKAVKKQAPTQKIEAYSNKYEEFDNHQVEIEPARALNDTTPISRASIFDVAKALNNKQKDDATKDFSNIEMKENSNSSDISSINRDDRISKTDEISWGKPEKEEPMFENNDYKTVIGNLYNKSQMSDPYEQSKTKTFKEIFPSSQITEMPKTDKRSEIDNLVEKSSASNIDCNDISMIANLYKLQGIDVRKHDGEHAKNGLKHYTDRNKLNMFSALITSLFMLAEVVLCYLILNKNGNIVPGQRLMYFLGGACACSIAIVFTLENYLNRYRLVVIETKFRREITKRLLIFLFATIITFAICLSLGMNDIGQREFLSFWLVPVFVSSNVVLSYIIFYVLFKSGKFSY